MSEHNIRFLDELHAEFRRLEHEEGSQSRHSPAQSRRRGRLRRTSRRSLTIAALLLTLLGGGAVAAVIALDDPGPSAGLIGSSDRHTLAEGVTSWGAPWLLAAARSGDGDNVCLSLRVGAADRDPHASSQCGGFESGKLRASAWTDPVHPMMLFGTVPAGADAVRVRVAEETREAQLADGSNGLAGRFFVLELPQRAYAEAQVSAHAHGRTLESLSVRQLLTRSSPLR
jgi:hypothetical protein